LTLDEVTLEPTQDDPSEGIESYLPWVTKGPLPKGGVPILTVEKRPRSNPIRLDTFDFTL
jgi:hypothetical protein